MRRRRRTPAPSRPWSPEEDDKLRNITAIGLANDWWHLALPDRSFHEITDRRLELQLPRAPLL